MLVVFRVGKQRQILIFMSNGSSSLNIFLTLFRMKKSLAIKLETEGSSNAPKRMLLTKPIEGGGGEKSVKTSLKLNIGLKVKEPSEKNSKTDNDGGTFRSKGISLLPASLLNTISSLKILDISHNKLSDSQIQLLFSSCLRLETLAIHDNMTTLIPASIWKMKNLENFRHDWVKLFQQSKYEPLQNLHNIKQKVRKPNLVTKHSGVLGINFESYCVEIMKIQISEAIQAQAKNSKCSVYAQNQIIQAINIALKIDKQEQTDIEIIENPKRDVQIMGGCFNVLNFQQERPKENSKWKEISVKKQENSKYNAVDESLKNIRSTQEFISVENVRDIQEGDGTTDGINQMSFPGMIYQHKDMPLHMLFSKYDKNSHSTMIDVDRLLLKGYNPNTYDHNGLSVYHIVTIFKQEKGLERLIEISFKNPGFFDLEMPSMKEGRNILHFSVFLKDYAFTKALIDFGLPIDKRDFNGARIVHLVDQNYEFLLLLRKVIKRKYQSMKTPSFLTYPEPLACKYCRHPPRMAQQANYQTFENKNLNLVQMYEAAVGSRGNRN